MAGFWRLERRSTLDSPKAHDGVDIRPIPPKSGSPNVSAEHPPEVIATNRAHLPAEQFHFPGVIGQAKQMKRKIAIMRPLAAFVVEFAAHHLQPSRKHCPGQLEEFALETSFPVGSCPTAGRVLPHFTTAQATNPTAAAIAAEYLVIPFGHHCNQVEWW